MKGLHMKTGTRKFKVRTYAGYNGKEQEVTVEADDFQYQVSVGDSTGKGYIAKSVTFYNNSMIGDEAHDDPGKALTYARRTNVAVFDSPQQVIEITPPQDRVHVERTLRRAEEIAEGAPLAGSLPPEGEED